MSLREIELTEGQMKNKIQFLTITYLFLPISLFAINGLSSTKLTIPSANVLTKGTTEIDINYYQLNSRKKYNERGQLIDYEMDCSNSCKRNRVAGGGFVFRTTSGIGNQIEIGLEVGHSIEKQQLQDFNYSYIDDLKLGLKWNFFHQDKIKISYQQGLTYDYEAFVPRYESGFLFSLDWEKFSIDFDLHYFATKRDILSQEDIIKQNGFFAGPHFGIGISYNIENLLFAIEYSYEEAKTKVDQYRYFSISEYSKLQNTGIAYIYNIENQEFHKLLSLPEYLDLNGILYPVPKIYKKQNYYAISQMIYYGISYSISSNVSLTLVLHQTVFGRNISSNRIINILTTITV